MQLTDTTKRDLKSLLERYTTQDRLADEKFINETLEIINADEKIDGKIRYEVVRKIISVCPKYIDGINYFDVNWIRNSIATFPENYREYYDEYYDGIIANIFAMYYILRDTVKTTHRLGLTGFEELNHLYYDLYQKVDAFSKRQYRKYLKSHKPALIDRNANVQAYKILSDIYQLSNIRMIPDLQYLKCLLRGYEQGNSSPAHIDLDYLGLDYDAYDFSNIPFLDALEHGVTEDGSKIAQASHLSEDYFDDKKSFNEVYKELRKVQ